MHPIRAARVAALAVLLASCGGSANDPGMPQPAQQRPRALPVAVVAPERLFDWAELTYPDYFPGHPPTEASGNYVYRYYAATATYLAVEGVEILVLGPPFGPNAVKVGTLADFTCRVLPSTCPGDRAEWVYGVAGMEIHEDGSTRAAALETYTVLPEAANTTERVVAASTPAMTYVLANGSTVSRSTATVECTYQPPYRASPLATAASGAVFTGGATETCVDKASGMPTSTTVLDHTGLVEGMESKSTPLGTFATLRYTATRKAVRSGEERVTTETCWMDTGSARTVECISAYAVSGGTSPWRRGRQVTRLEAYKFALYPWAGDEVRRFHGAWTLSLTGDATASCDAVQVDPAGRVSGSCVVAGAEAAGLRLLSGSISSSGDVGLVMEGSAWITGTAATERGSGHWTTPHLNLGAAGMWALQRAVTP